jgi:hypothetical protein
MKRRTFLGFLSRGAAVAVVAPIAAPLLKAVDPPLVFPVSETMQLHLAPDPLVGGGYVVPPEIARDLEVLLTRTSFARMEVRTGPAPWTP